MEQYQVHNGAISPLPLRSYSGCWIHRLSLNTVRHTQSLLEASLEIAKGSRQKKCRTTLPTNSTYPEEATKAVKGVIRKRAKKFQFVNQGVLSVLHYTENTGSLPDDRVGGCHFGQDRTIDKVTALLQSIQPLVMMKEKMMPFPQMRAISSKRQTMEL